MRLLGRKKFDGSYGKGNFNIFFIKKNRFFISSEKFHYANANCNYSAQIIIDLDGENNKIIDTHTPGITKASKKATGEFVQELGHFLRNSLLEEDVAAKVLKYDADNNLYLVRHLNEITTSQYAPGAQSLGVITGNSVNWFTCREEFANRFTSKTDRIFFCTSPGSAVKGKKDYIGARLRARRVARFIRRIEEKLKVDFSTFYESSSFNVLDVHPSKFWKSNDLNRSLYTILLRAGLIYDYQKDNYMEALKGYVYSKNTIKAVSRFLDGHTTFKGQKLTGWNNTFQSPANEDVKKVLV